VVFAGNDFFRYGATLLIMSTFSPGTFPPPQSFIVQTDIEAAAWIDKGLLPFRRESEGVLVGEIVPSGFDAYARVFHPARRYFGPSIEQSTALPWSEIAAARGKTVHPEMQIEALWTIGTASTTPTGKPSAAAGASGFRRTNASKRRRRSPSPDSFVRSRRHQMMCGSCCGTATVISGATSTASRAR
jgi:hypothetical protein